MTRSYLGYVSSQTTDILPIMVYGAATGGTSSSITVGGEAYTLLTFTATGTLTVTKAGLFDYIAVGGGGTGGGNGRGGGAGGCIIQGTVYLTGNETITISAGDAESGGASSGTRRHTNAYSSIGNDVLAFCGAGGGTSSGGVGIFGAGNGGNVYDNNGASGSDISAFLGQAGGTTYRSGGGGSGSSNTTVRTGGAGGGGNGGTTSSTNGVAGTANTGGGGGGAADGGSGASGGSGVVYVRFKV